LPLEQPQAQVSIDGIPVAGLVELEVDAGGYFQAGRFQAGFAIGAAPVFGGTYFSSLTNQNITIEVAPDGVGFVTLLTGRIDAVRIDWVRNIAFLLGRDLTGLLIDTEITETYVNQTASQIAGTIADEHGLIPNITPTTTLVGQYYQRDHARTALGLNAHVTTEWELLTALAQEEGFLVSVVENVLNFGAAQIGSPIFITPGNLSALTFDMITALPGAVTVKSWNSRNKNVVAETYGTGLTTTIVRPNFTQTQAQNLAQNHAQILSQHQLIMQARMPGDTVLNPGMELVLGGTGMGLDQTYVVDTVRRRLDGKAGFVQDIRAHAAAAVI
jgi:phage protein D